MQTIGIVANCISKESKGSTSWLTSNGRSTISPSPIASSIFRPARSAGDRECQLREQAEAAIKDKIAT